MKILLANNKLRYMGGTESFTYTLGAQLVKMGHHVDVFTFRPGQISERMKTDHGIATVDGTGKYDVVLANHTPVVKHLRETKAGFIIQTCHGITTALEQPSPFAHAFVGISQELCKHVEQITERPASLILNGIDCTRFKPVKPLNLKVKRVLSMANSEDVNRILERKFHTRGIDFIVHSKLEKPVWNIEDKINEVDMVVSLGRGCYEAMACGRPVMIVDQRPGRPLKGDWITTDSLIDEQIYYNCRGEAFKETDLEKLVNASVHIYSPLLGEWCRNYALAYLTVEQQAEKYISLCKQLIWFIF